MVFIKKRKRALIAALAALLAAGMLMSCQNGGNGGQSTAGTSESAGISPVSTIDPLTTVTNVSPTNDPTVTPTVDPTFSPTPTTTPATTEPTPYVPEVEPGDVVNWCAHDNTKKIADVAATCTTDGYKDRLQCTDCGAVLDGTGKIIPAYGHSYSNRSCVYCSKAQPSLVTGGQYSGGSVIWQLYDDGELAVSGKGAIPDFATEENGYFYKYSKTVTSIVVYPGVTRIGDNAFRGLREVTTISISSTVHAIGDRAFDGWSLKTLNLSYGLATVGEDNFTNNQLFFLELPGSMTNVGAGSFSSAQLVTLRVPATVKSYAAHENQYSNLRNVVFMGDEESAKNLDLYRHLRLDGACANVELKFKFTAAASTLAYCTRRGLSASGFTYNLYSDGSAIITAYKGSSDNVVIPETLDGHDVIGVEHECFKNNKTIEKVTLPATLKHIYYNAFIDSGIEELTVLADGVCVGEGAFSGCSSLRTINMEGSFADVGGKAFAGTRVEDIKLSPDMKIARISSFASSYIKNVNYTQFEIIGDSAFARTTSYDIDLTGVCEVGFGAFYNVGAKTVNVTNVGFIAHAAFTGNGSLKTDTVTGLETVGKIEDGAFPFVIT